MSDSAPADTRSWPSPAAVVALLPSGLDDGDAVVTARRLGLDGADAVAVADQGAVDPERVASPVLRVAGMPPERRLVLGDLTVAAEGRPPSAADAIDHPVAVWIDPATPAAHASAAVARGARFLVTDQPGTVRRVRDLLATVVSS